MVFWWSTDTQTLTYMFSITRETKTRTKAKRVHSLQLGEKIALTSSSSCTEDRQHSDSIVWSYSVNNLTCVSLVVFVFDMYERELESVLKMSSDIHIYITLERKVLSKEWRWNGKEKERIPKSCSLKLSFALLEVDRRWIKKWMSEQNDTYIYETQLFEWNDCLMSKSTRSVQREV